MKYVIITEKSTVLAGHEITLLNKTAAILNKVSLTEFDNTIPLSCNNIPVIFLHIEDPETIFPEIIST